MIVKGIAYFVTNWHRVYALDASSGKTIWTKDLPILNITSSGFACSFPQKVPCGLPPGHYHNNAFVYTDKIGGKPLIWVSAVDYQIIALNALTGDIVLQFQWFDANQPVPGNHGLYDVLASPAMVIDQVNGIMVIGTSNVDCQCEGRGFMEGFDLTTTPPKQLWRTFVMPPQDGSNPNWSLSSVQNMSHAYIFNGTAAVDLKALPATQQHDVLYNDWGNDGFNGTRSYGGVGLGWGGPWSVDSQTGVVIAASAETAVDWNSTLRPGPGLWGSSIFAVNERTGSLIWGFQGTAHDNWDWDCSWGTLLTNQTINGAQEKVVLKSCKNGYFWALDEGTGKMLWYFNPPSVMRNQYSQLYDPRNKAQMTKPWFTYPSTKPAIMSPWATGALESDPAYDPSSNTVFIASFNHPGWFKIAPVGPKTPYFGAGASFAFVGPTTPALNTTIYALNAATGQEKWHFFIKDVDFVGGGLSVSGGVVYVMTVDGVLRYLDASSGKLIGQILTSGLITQPSIGQDASGNSVVLLPVGGTGSAVATTPGAIIALSIPPAVVQTQTQVSTSTVVTATNTIVTNTIVQTSTTAATGIDPTTFYAVAGVAVIFLIATGFLAVRRRKPAT